MQGNRIRRNGGWIAPWLVVTAVCILPAHAADPGWPDTPVLSNAEPVSEQELGDMRGRFMDGGQVVRFGISMVSRMQSSTEDIMGGLDMDFDFSGKRPRVGFKPTMSIESRNGAPSASGNGNGDVSSQVQESQGSGGSKTGNGTGVEQRVQVAGNGNSAHNGMTVDVIKETKNGSGKSESGSIPGNRIETSPDGSSVVQITTGSNGVRLSLHKEGTGHVTQEISRGRLQQLIQLNGDRNHASSGARLRVELRDRMEQSSGASVSRAIQELKTLR